MGDTIVVETEECITIITESDGASVVTDSRSPVVVKDTAVGPHGPPGEIGPSASEDQSNFSWGDATPAILFESEAGTTIYEISLVILEPFDGIGAALSIGVTGDPELFMAGDECDPKTAGVYSVTPGYKFAAAGTIRLFITPGAGASKGNGAVMIDF
jgi:hypothetical protein